jgi:uncharacterized protein
LNFWRQAPAKRTMVLRRHTQSRLVAVLELLLTLNWAVACAVSVMTGWIGLVTLAPAMIVMWFVRPRVRLATGEDALMLQRRRDDSSPWRLDREAEWRGRSWGWLATLVLALVAAVAGQIPALAALSWSYDHGFSLPKLQSAASDGVAVAILLGVSTPVQVGLLFWFARLRGSSAMEYLALTLPRKRDFAILILTGVVLLAASDGLSQLMGKDVVTSFQTDILRSAASAGAVVWLWLAVVVVAPIGEELLFRGFLFRGWQRSPNDAWAAIGVTAVLWAVVHVQYDLLVIGEILLVGLGLGWVRWRTDSTISTILLHAFLNAIGMAEASVRLNG